MTSFDNERWNAGQGDLMFGIVFDNTISNTFSLDQQWLNFQGAGHKNPLPKIIGDVDLGSKT